MALLETLQEHKLAVAAGGGILALGVLALVVGGLVVGVPAAIDYVQGVQAEAGNVTMTESSGDDGVVLTMKVVEMNSSDYMNVVVNGGTDQPRPGVTVEEAANITTTPADQVGSTDPDEPLDGPPDVDADSVGDVVTIRGLREGDIVRVVGVDTEGSTTTRVVFETYEV